MVYGLNLQKFPEAKEKFSRFQKKFLRGKHLLELIKSDVCIPLSSLSFDFHIWQIKKEFHVKERSIWEIKGVQVHMVECEKSLKMKKLRTDNGG